MPSAGISCPNPNCSTESMSVAGELCLTCMEVYFTRREQQILRYGKEADIGAKMSEVEKSNTKEKLLDKVSKIKSGNESPQREITSFN